MKNVVVLHLYEINNWSKFSSMLNQIEDDFDLYVTYSDESIEIEKSIKKDFSDSKIFNLVHIKNDTASFMYVLEYIFKNELNYNVLFKLHDYKLYTIESHLVQKEIRNKSTLNVRTAIDDNTILNDTVEPINSLIGNDTRYKNVLISLKEDSDLGMCCLLTNIIMELNLEFIRDFIESFNLSKINRTNMYYPCDRIFAIKFKLLKNTFADFNLSNFYLNINDNYYLNLHKLERIFGFSIINQDHDILALKNIRS